MDERSNQDLFDSTPFNSWPPNDRKEEVKYGLLAMPLAWPDFLGGIQAAEYGDRTNLLG